MNLCYAPRRVAFSLLLAAVGCSMLPPLLSGQATPTQGGAAANAQLPAAVQAQLDKLEADLKAARTAGDSKAETKTLIQVGGLFYRNSDYRRALDYLNQVLPILHHSSDRAGEAAILKIVGTLYTLVGDKPKAIESYSQSLPILRAMGDQNGEVAMLNIMGSLYSSLGETQKALDCFNMLLPIVLQLGDLRSEAATLNSIATIDVSLGEYPKALQNFNQALPMLRQAGDRSGEAKALVNIGSMYFSLGEMQKALEFLNQALPLLHQLQDSPGEAVTENSLGLIYDALGEKQRALECYNQALPIFRKLDDPGKEAIVLSNIGQVYDAVGDKQKAQENFNQSLSIMRRIGDRHGEATTLNNIGQVNDELGKREEALQYYNQALPIIHQLGDRAVEARILNNIAVVYNELGERQKALNFYVLALPVVREVGDSRGEGWTLNNIAVANSALGNNQEALEFYTQALFIASKVGDRAFEASALANIGSVYATLGQTQKALEYFNQALLIQRQVGDRGGAARTLSNMGAAYATLGDKQKALECYNEALPITRDVGDRDGEAVTLNNIARVYFELGDRQHALEKHIQALRIFREVGDRDDEAGTLNNIGLIYDKRGEPQKAQEYYTQAMPLATAVDDPLLEAVISYNLMANQKNVQTTLAIFHGKQAVNLLQKVRRNNQALDKELGESFLSSKEVYYHDLADLLVTQGRLPEAQQVLDLLKEQEYSDYVRDKDFKPTDPLSLTPAEQHAEADYQESTEKLVAVGEQWAALKKVESRTVEQEKQLKELSDQMETASKGLNDYYDRLYVLFGKDSAANKQVADVKGDVAELEDRIAETQHTAALYTMVTADHYRVIVITPGATVAREYSISEAELNKKVAAFEQVLRDPTADPKPLAKKLYDILIGPVKADLDQAQAQTLVWSLDGVLRYVPIAALYDGKQYVVENYKVVTITPVSIAHLGEKPDVSNLSAAAMGISHKYEEGLVPLPAVVGELDEIVKDAKVEGANGVLPGTILLDGQFTEAAMEKQLDAHHGVVHIASHFVFKPGDDSQSYLLLAGKETAGTGFHLTVADFRDNKNLELRHTDLLTLSACETGMSGNASNGREVDGLGTTAQMKGARAVISTLWSVNDASTGKLMGDFYKRWAAGAGKVEKVEALRQAQLDLLLGRVTAEGGTDGRGFRTKHEEVTVPKGYAHPYYWAPFVLMGNWR